MHLAQVRTIGDGFGPFGVTLGPTVASGPVRRDRGSTRPVTAACIGPRDAQGVDREARP